MGNNREYLDILNHALSLLLSMHIVELERNGDDSPLIKPSLIIHLKKLGDIKKQRGDK